MGKTVTSASGPCLHCVCQEDGFMHCDPQRCKPEAPLMLKMNSNFFRRRQLSTLSILKIFQFPFRLNEGVQIVVGIKKKGQMWRFMFPFLVPALFSVLKQYSVRRSTFVSLSLFLCVYLCNYLFFFQTPITVVNLKKKMNAQFVMATNYLFNSIGAVHSS